MTIVIATNNAHKVREFGRILPRVALLTPGDVGVRFAYAERGATFMANALGKARRCLALVGGRYAVLADDSGICVDALGGRPGVRSARFGREQGVRGDDDWGRNALLLKRLGAKAEMGHTHPKIPAVSRLKRLRAGAEAGRSAHYVCAAVLIDPLQRIYAVQERWDGAIAAEPSAGQRGFGYDPIFIPREYAQTVAELADEQKDRYSHRAKALRAVMAAYMK